MKLEEGKFYRSRDGHRVKIVKLVNLFDVDKAIGVVYYGGKSCRVAQYLCDGMRTKGCESKKDLVAKWGPYDDWEIDKKIYVWANNKANAVPRHFAGISESGKVMAFMHGATSFSADNGKNPMEWLYVMPKEEYEREKAANAK